MKASFDAVRNLVRSMGSGALDLLWPNVCGACADGVPDRDGLCQECARKLLDLAAIPYCPRCGASRGPNIPIYPGGCWACPDPLPRFGRVLRVGPYATPLREVIRNLKYHRRTGPGKFLAKYLSERIAAEALHFDAVVPVPPYWFRRWQRGVDHTQWLAERLSRALRAPLVGGLTRIRNTPPQVHLSKTKRAENVRGAFAPKGDCLRGAHVLLCDDVTTSGATANECARTLLRAGASQVTLAVVAKGEPPHAYQQHRET